MKTTLMSIVLALGISGSVYAANPTTNVTKEDRQKMADAHMKMAECLKSDKSMNDCHNEMMSDKKTMQMMMEKGGCPMMADHMAGMKDHKAKSTDKK